jgi:hypothetical protein
MRTIKKNYYIDVSEIRRFPSESNIVISPSEIRRFPSESNTVISPSDIQKFPSESNTVISPSEIQRFPSESNTVISPSEINHLFHCHSTEVFIIENIIEHPKIKNKFLFQMSYYGKQKCNNLCDKQYNYLAYRISKIYLS